MRQEVVDFEPAKPLSLVNAVKLESKMRLGKAKLAAQKGDQEQALEEFKAAAEAWPENPDLDTAASGFFQSQDVKNQGTVEFDRLIAEQNYRGVFDKQLPFLGAIKGDSKREDELKGALEKVKESETAIEKASLLQRNGDEFGAWEALDIASKDWPEDSKLNRMLADLAMKSAEFVSALNKAQEAETRGQYGYSLSWYVNAQAFYPASQIANDGIHRVSAIILKKES
jgi:thioredoxin-like negative regulator of GroEL